MEDNGLIKAINVWKPANNFGERLVEIVIGVLIVKIMKTYRQSVEIYIF